MAIDPARVLDDVPLMPGATRVQKSQGGLRYVLAGDQEAGVYAHYKRELEVRGFRFKDQAGSASVYERNGTSVAVNRDWMNNGDTLVIVSWH